MYRNKIETILTEAILKAFPNRDVEKFFPIPLEICSNKEFGDYSSTIPIKLAAVWEADPSQIAASIVNSIDRIPIFCQSIKHSSSGFINITLSKDAVYYGLMALLQGSETTDYVYFKSKKNIEVILGSSSDLVSLNAEDGRQLIVGAFVQKLLKNAGCKISCDILENESGETLWLISTAVEHRYRELLGDESSGQIFGFRSKAIVELAKKIIANYGANFLFIDRPLRISTIKEALYPIIASKIQRLCKDINVDLKETVKTASLNGKKGVYQEIFKKFKENDLIYEEDVIPINNWLCSHKEEFKPGKPQDAKKTTDICFEKLIKAYRFWESPTNREKQTGEEFLISKQERIIYPIKTQTWIKSSQFGDFSDQLLYLPNGEPSDYFQTLAFLTAKFKLKPDQIVVIQPADKSLEFYNTYSSALKFLGYDETKLKVIAVEKTYIKNHPDSQELQKGENIGAIELAKFFNKDEYWIKNLEKNPQNKLYIDCKNSDFKFGSLKLALTRFDSAFQAAYAQGYRVNPKEMVKHLSLTDLKLLNNDKEIEIIKTLIIYPSILYNVMENYNTGILYDFLKNLTKLFNDYYESVKILVGDRPTVSVRIAMLKAVKTIVTRKKIPLPTR